MSIFSVSRGLAPVYRSPGWICSNCLQCILKRKLPSIDPGSRLGQARWLNSEESRPDIILIRKLPNDEVKQRRATSQQKLRGRKHEEASKLKEWELTVGIEIHAQLNTERKLFSDAATSNDGDPNTNVALFDLAIPGSQPLFQQAALLPALRAALALDCKIQQKSKFDRKHYFYQDQPAGYQITQYYEPFARDGTIVLHAHDGVAPEDAANGPITIGIKQIQLEQDTAKTVQESPDTMLLDFNRVGHPLIEIITLPQIHHPQTAAACVRKIQSMLQAVNAVTAGMEMGGLRADVNVSVRRREAESVDGVRSVTHEYYGVKGLGQRTEIKNLSSFKAVEDAVISERDRQIAILEAGGKIEGETRGWSLGSTETRKLRGKEGEVDYRYMPDPDISPLVISNDLISNLAVQLPSLPEPEIQNLHEGHGITLKDAKTLVALDNGDRVDYFEATMNILYERGHGLGLGKTVANWVLHEIGGLFSGSGTSFSATKVPASTLASIIQNLDESRITGKTAKQLLSMVFAGDNRPVNDIIEQENLLLKHLSEEEYGHMAQILIREHPEMAEKVRRKGQVGKVQWFVGQMMRQGEGKVEAVKAEATLKRLFGLSDSSPIMHLG